MDKNENYQLRKLLWLNHGCPIRSLYGDDGEMQCNSCLIDFKRDSVEDIERHLTSAMYSDGEGRCDCVGPVHKKTCPEHIKIHDKKLRRR